MINKIILSVITIASILFLVSFFAPIVKEEPVPVPECACGNTVVPTAYCYSIQDLLVCPAGQEDIGGYYGKATIINEYMERCQVLTDEFNSAIEYNETFHDIMCNEECPLQPTAYDRCVCIDFEMIRYNNAIEDLVSGYNSDIIELQAEMVALFQEKYCR